MAEKKAVAKKAPAKKAPAKKRQPKKVEPTRAQQVAVICERIAMGESVREICRDEALPNASTLYRWLEDDADLREQYARAREAQADTIFDEILEIADDARNDWMERRDEEDAGYEFNGEHVQRAKLRIEARKWMASKLRPKKYGDKLELGGQVGVVIEGAQVTFRTAPKGEA